MMLPACSSQYAYLCFLCLPFSEALPKKKHQPRQIQTSNAPTLPQHALRGPAGSASTTPTSSAHGPVHVLPGSYVAACSSSTAASPPALTPHTQSLSLHVSAPTECHDATATAASIITSSGSQVSYSLPTPQKKQLQKF